MAFEQWLAALLAQAAASGGGPSGYLAAPAPATRHGDTIGSMNGTARPAMTGPIANDGIPFPSQGGPAYAGGTQTLRPGGGTPQSAMSNQQLNARGPGYGSQAARVNGTGGGQVVVPPVPGMGGALPTSPGLGYGIPMPLQFEDRSFAAPGINRWVDGIYSRQIDPTAQLMAAWLSQRFPNDPPFMAPPGWDVPRTRKEPYDALGRTYGPLLSGSDTDPMIASWQRWLLDRIGRTSGAL